MAQVRYIVRDVEEAVTFYTEMLGFSVSRHFKAIAILTREDLELWLAGPDASASRPMPDGEVPAPGGWNRIVITVQRLESTVIDLRARGVPFRNEIVEGPGGKQILCVDPSGNIVELFEPA